MIESFHRLTYFWLERDPGASWSAAREFLIGIRSSRVSSMPREGHICRDYDPEALHPEAPGYTWLRERLRELATEVPAELGDSPFDALPAFDPQHPVQDRDPFPAFFWRMKSQERYPWGIFEVLVGWDFVVFHQCAMSEARPGEGADILRRLEETGWVLRHDSPAALFTAEFTQVSHLEAVDRPLWSDKIARFQLRSPSSFTFSRDAIEYEIQLGIRQDSKDGRDYYDGLVLVEHVSSDAENAQTPSNLHLEATGFLTRLTTLLGNSSKIAWENSQAEIKYKGVGQEFKADLAELDRLQKQRAEVLPAPLTRSEIGKLRRIYHSARKNLDQVSRLVETCRLNLRQFEDISSGFLHERDPWARDTILKLRRLIDDLQVARRALETKGQWLQEEIHLLLATGGRFAGDSVPELLRDPGSREERSRPLPDGLLELIMVGGSAEEDLPTKPATLWIVGRDGLPGDRDDTQTPFVLRPSVVSLDRREDLIDLYVEALGDCPPDRLRHLLDLFFSGEGHLHLATGKADRSRSLQIGRIFTATADPDFWKEGALRGILVGPFSEAYAQTSAETDQDWVGMICLRSFIEAIVRFLVHPPAHLASVAREHWAARPRLLFLMGFLHIVSGQSDEAKGYLRRAARSALDHRDFPWSYFVAQFFREYEGQFGAQTLLPEQAVLKTTQQRRQLWKDQLALEFLKVYDLDSAVSLARASLPSRKGRPWRMRAVLWVFAFITGSVLLLSDRIVGPSPPLWFAPIQDQWRGFIIISASVLAVLGAPLALWLGARGAMKQLFPDILLPRVLGAITLAAIALCASSETEQLVMAKPPIFAIIVLMSLTGGIGYLYSEVRKKMSSGGECLRRCFDVFCLAFLEATSLSAGFVLIYEGMFEAAFGKTPPGRSGFYSVYGVFLRPRNIFLIAILSMFVGIVVQLMTQFSDKRLEDELE